MEASNLTEFQTRVDTKPLPEAEKYSSNSFNANFAEVWVNDSTGMVRVKNFVSATGAGRILNPKTSHSQMIGGVIWGIGQALTRRIRSRSALGKFCNEKLRRLSHSFKSGYSRNSDNFY